MGRYWKSHPELNILRVVECYIQGNRPHASSPPHVTPQLLPQMQITYITLKLFRSISTPAGSPDKQNASRRDATAACLCLRGSVLNVWFQRTILALQKCTGCRLNPGPYWYAGVLYRAHHRLASDAHFNIIPHISCFREEVSNLWPSPSVCTEMGEIWRRIFHSVACTRWDTAKYSRQ